MKLYVIIVLCLLSGGCVTTSELGKCVLSSRQVVREGTTDGLQMRFAIGKRLPSDKGTHQWAEYWNTSRNKWCIWDRTYWPVGKSWYTAEECGYKTYVINTTGYRSPKEIVAG